ncbi:MAG: nucleotidyltransferase [Eubacterium sp.]|nr:nucleotidyltransferase [Eubacterium sp.]
MSDNREKKPILLVMAAGMGSRYGGLKQIDPVGNHGEVILDFSLYDAMLAGFERVVFVIKEQNEEDFRKLIDGRAGKYLDVKYAFQKMDDIPEGYDIPEDRVKPWGTAHAVYSAREYIDAPFCVINADDYYGPGAFQTIYEFLESRAECEAEESGSCPDEKEQYAMVAFQLDKTLTENGHVARGVCEVSDEGILKTVTERTKIMWRPESDVDGAADDTSEKGLPDDEAPRVPAYTEDDGKTWNRLSEDTPVSMNFWGFSRSFMDAVADGMTDFMETKFRDDPLKAEYFLPTVVERMIGSGKAEVKVLRSSDKWYGVTYKEDKETVVNALQSMKDKGFYPEKLWK